MKKEKSKIGPLLEAVHKELGFRYLYIVLPPAPKKGASLDKAIVQGFWLSNKRLLKGRDKQCGINFAGKKFVIIEGDFGKQLQEKK